MRRFEASLVTHAPVQVVGEIRGQELGRLLEYLAQAGCDIGLDGRCVAQTVQACQYDLHVALIVLSPGGRSVGG